MSPPDVSRRRFFAMLAGLAGAGVTAGWAWVGNRGSEPTAATASSVRPAATSTAPQATTTASRPSTATTPTTAESARIIPSPEPPASSTTTSIEPTSTTSTSSTTPTTVAPPTTTTVLSGMRDVQAICKAGWGGRVAAGAFTTHSIERMTVHHTEALLDSNRNVPSRLRSHQRFHIDDRGWADIAYHFIVDANGDVYEGRPVTAVGDTGTNYDPTGHFLVCAEGDFNRQSIPAAQVAAVVDLLAWGAVQFGVDASSIRGHRDWAATTSCPGDGFYPLISSGSLEQAVHHRIAGGAPVLTVLCGDAAGQKVADIEAGLI